MGKPQVHFDALTQRRQTFKEVLQHVGGHGICNAFVQSVLLYSLERLRCG